MAAPSRSPALCLILLGLGAALWAAVTRGYPGPPDALYIVPIAIAIAAAASAWRHRRSSTHHRHHRPRRLWRRAAFAGAAACGYFLLTAVWPGRDLFPKYHDEFALLIQARMLLHGRLWMPPIPAEIAPFLDTHYLILRPVYAAQYWPGEAMLLAAALAAQLPPFLIAALVSGAVAGLFYWIVATLISRRWAPLATLMMLAVEPFRHQSVSISAMGTVMFAALLTVVAWLNWRRSGKHAWALLMGAAAGWALITRPVDALCYLMPIAAAIAIDAWSHRPATRRARIAGFITAALAALPFLIVQLVFDRGVTGQWLQSPFVAYARADFPQVEFGFPRYDPAARPQSPLLQKQILYQQWAVPYVIAHQWPAALRDTWRVRLPLTLLSPSPHPLLLILLPVGLLGLRSGRRRRLPRRTIVVALPLFLVLYGCYTFFLPHYPMVIAPAAVLLMLLALDALRRTWPGRVTSMLLPAATAGLCIAVLPQFTHAPEDANFSPSVLAAMQLPRYIHPPAIVLFRFDPNVNNVHDEPVYNADVAWPDDARIIRAHDLGPAADQALFRYYASRQPHRMVYQFNQATGLLRPLGTAQQLAARGSAGGDSP